MHTLLFAVFGALTVVAADPSALLREPDMTLERSAFEAVPLRADGAVMTDATGEGDIVVFDRGTGGAAPDAIIDLSSVEMTPEGDAWKVLFRFVDPLPAEPQYPINFDLFVDSDGDRKNNAKTGVFRAGSDRAFLLLFGTKTKWHTLTWQFDPSNDRWAQLTTPVEFAIGEKDVTLTIPSSLLPMTPPKNATVRAFALTSTGGITATDVAPGMALPEVRTVPLSDDTSSGMSGKVLLGVFVALLGGSLFLWYKGSRR